MLASIMRSELDPTDLRKSSLMVNCWSRGRDSSPQGCKICFYPFYIMIMRSYLFRWFKCADSDEVSSFRKPICTEPYPDSSYYGFILNGLENLFTRVMFAVLFFYLDRFYSVMMVACVNSLLKKLFVWSFYRSASIPYIFPFYWTYTLWGSVGAVLSERVGNPSPFFIAMDELCNIFERCFYCCY